MLRTILKEHRSLESSIIAFNIQNITHLHILHKITKSLKKPAIAQLSSRYVLYWENRIGLKHLVNKYQKNGVYFHLDHCDDVNLIKFCIDSNLAGVMFDGSSHSIEENIHTTNEIADYLKKNMKETVLEVEIGSIKGVEDDYEGGENVHYYDEKELDLFVDNAEFDLLALAIGNAHGVYESITEVRPQLLKKATKKYPNLNLVLHGATGLPDDMIIDCIKYGVVKINVSTELKITSQQALKNYSATSDYFNESEWYKYAENAISPFFEKYINKYTK